MKEQQLAMNKTKKEKKKETLPQFIGSIIFIVFVVLLARTLIWEPFRIPSESMLPRLEVGDFISTNKAAYGWSKRSPTFFTLPFVPDGRLNPFGSSPKRGDIVVFRNHRTKEDTITIKRVVGLPGEAISIVDNVIHINEVPFEREILDKKVNYYGKASLERYRETMPNGRSYITYHVANKKETKRAFLIPENQYFLMGDNRDNSADSRWWGTIEETHILGRANMINLNFFQSLKGKRIFVKMQDDTRDYDEYQAKHPLD